VSLNPEAAAGWFGLALPFTPIISISREGAGVPKWAARPLQQHLSPQCGEGTPQATGFFEVMVAGKLVHSKKRGDGYVDTESKFLKLVAAIKAALAQG